MASPSLVIRPDRCVFCRCEEHGSNPCGQERIEASTGDYTWCLCDGGQGVRFIEVPYELAPCWLGVSWTEIEVASGLPAAVLQCLTPNSQARVRDLVVWADVTAYASAHEGRRRPRPGRAWIGLSADGHTRQIVGYMNTPMVVGQRKRWRW